MREEKRSRILVSAFLIIALIACSIYSIRGSQVTQSTREATSQLLPPAPTAPYWTYKAGAAVRTVAVSADGNTVVAGSNDNTIYVFGRSSNTTLWTYKTDDLVRSVAVSDNGSTIVAGSWDNKVYAFDRSSNTTLWTYKTGFDACTVSISADGNTIVAGSDDDKVYVFGRSSNATLWTYKTNDDVRGVAVSADGNTIVAGSLDMSIHAFGRSSNATLWNYTASDAVYGVAVSGDGNTIVAGSTDNHIRVFARSSNATLWTYGTNGDVYGPAVSRDGKTIVAGSYDFHLRVFGRSTNTTLVDYETAGQIERCAATSSDGSAIACGSSFGGFPEAYLFSKTDGLVWSYATGAGIGGVPSDSGPCVAISADGSLSAYGGSTGKVFVFQYDMVAPVLGSPSVSPSNPVGGQNVNISISATDNIGISTVTLYYRNTASGSWSSVAMSLAGSTYKATVGSFSSGDIVDYYVSAADTSSNTVCSPTDSPLSYYVFTVGTPPPVAAPAGIEWTSVLLGAALGAVIAIVVCFALLRGKKR